MPATSRKPVVLRSVQEHQIRLTQSPDRIISDSVLDAHKRFARRQSVRAAWTVLALLVFAVMLVVLRVWLINL